MVYHTTTLCRNAKLTIHPTYTVGNPSLLIQHFKIQRVGHLQQTDELIISFKRRWSRQPGFANNKTTQSNLNFSWNWSWLMYQTPQQTADVSAFGKKSSDHDLRIAWNKFQATGLSVRWGWVALNLAWPRWPGGQFNWVSTDFSTGFLVLQGVQHYYKNSVEKCVEISTKLLNWPPAVQKPNNCQGRFWQWGLTRRLFLPISRSLLSTVRPSQSSAVT